MHVQHKQKESKGMFFVKEEGNTVAEMTYSSPSQDRMIIEHTRVDEALRGKDIGYKLVHSAVEYARKHSLTITPECSFASSVFKKTPEYSDVLHT